MADVQDLIAAIVNKDALEVQNIFGELMASKVAEKIDDARPEVAESMFGEARTKCNECGYGMAKEDDACPKCAAGVKEEVEQIDELSPKLLDRAARASGEKSHNLSRQALKTYQSGDTEGSNRLMSKASDERRRGMRLRAAADKKAGKETAFYNKQYEEVESIDELSKKTLVSYGQKARQEGGRTPGVTLAVKKILAASGKGNVDVKVPANEAEQWMTQEVKHSSGKTVKLAGYGKDGLKSAVDQYKGHGYNPVGSSSAHPAGSQPSGDQYHNLGKNSLLGK